MASSKKYVKINPRLRMLKAHTLEDGKTTITTTPSAVTAAQLKEVLEFTVNGHPVAVETDGPSDEEETPAPTETADNAEGQARSRARKG